MATDEDKTLEEAYDGLADTLRVKQEFQRILTDGLGVLPGEHLDDFARRIVRELQSWRTGNPALPAGLRTLTIVWHEYAIREAVEHGVAVTQTVDPDHAIYESPDAVLTWTDLACLLDMARTWIREQEKATP